MDKFKLSCLCASLFLLSGCPTGTTSNSQSSVFNDGLTANIQANIHEDETSARVAASVFQDGVRVNLVAADVFEAATATKGVLLQSINVHTGDYIGTLPIDDTSLPVTVTIQHEPIDARNDRWYPVDILLVDPGPGELVGRFATVSFPPEINIQSPANNTIYMDRNDAIDISWLDAGEGDTIRASARVVCSNSNAELAYGVSYELGDDADGMTSLQLNKFVYNDTLTAVVLGFVDQISRIFLAATVQVLTFGLIDAEELANTTIDIETANCDIDLTLIREREGSLDDEFDGGQAFGSRSASVTILYRPSGI
ncbi:hypothetical protein A9Q99_06490 [Gammaproteobacteria bacterium 45_16_T64]|nr:hypothetical protein A9Q99_06490 [Gammaproteobacteria bacterium 45_16_T64]